MGILLTDLETIYIWKKKTGRLEDWLLFRRIWVELPTTTCHFLYQGSFFWDSVAVLWEWLQKAHIFESLVTQGVEFDIVGEGEVLNAHT